MPKRMKIPNWLKKHICTLCGQPCIKLTEGDGWVHKPTGKRLDLSVCWDCYMSGRKPGNPDAALDRAAELQLEFMQDVALRAEERLCTDTPSDKYSS